MIKIYKWWKCIHKNDQRDIKDSNNFKQAFKWVWEHAHKDSMDYIEEYHPFKQKIRYIDYEILPY